jgi:paired amphipathic helix protein Sin3a
LKVNNFDDANDKFQNRFQDRPEIYKQFLEILQTYQRESKPIQDVYAQVTSLFNDAQDLLEDFKQFLPESAAQAKQQAAEAAERAAQLAGVSQTPQGGARGETKMPPVGNFAVPASNSKDKKRRNAPTASGPQVNAIAEGSGRGGMGGPNNKVCARSLTSRTDDCLTFCCYPRSFMLTILQRPKLHHKTLTSDAPAVSPTLTPIVPEPLAPTSTSSATSEELAFFDRVKKFIANKATMNEFLKLCNLFSQDLIDRNVLVHKVSNFIGGNHDLMTWFKAFVNYEGEDELIDNQPKAPSGRVALSNCRGLGPSYRLLPKIVSIHLFISVFPATSVFWDGSGARCRFQLAKAVPYT